MKRAMFCLTGIIILFTAIDIVLAQGRSQGNTPRREMPARVRQPIRRPADVNEMARSEKSRQEMRERMRQRAAMRRRRVDQNEMPDINTPGARGRNALRQKAAGTGEMHKQQLTALKRQMPQELAKHRERVAKLTRIRELAQQQGDTETVSRVDKLLEQNQQRYEAKTQRMERKKNLIIELQKKAAADKNTGSTEADKSKP